MIPSPKKTEGEATEAAGSHWAARLRRHKPALNELTSEKLADLDRYVAACVAGSADAVANDARRG